MLRVVVAFAILLTCTQSEARHRARKSLWAGGGQTGEFRTSRCKSGSCFERHPNGRWRHPLTQSLGRKWRAGM